MIELGIILFCVCFFAVCIIAIDGMWKDGEKALAIILICFTLSFACLAVGGLLEWLKGISEGG